MIRSALVLTAGLFVSSVLQAQEAIVFPANQICTSLDGIKNAIKDYNEIPFAQGIGAIRSAKDDKQYEAYITVYLSDSGSFTITAEMDQGIHCMLTSGIKFKPVISTELMH